MFYNLLDAAATGESNPTMLIVMGVIAVAIIGLFVWQTISGRKKQKEAVEKINKLAIGDKVKTIGGVCGFVVEIDDGENTFVLETGTESQKSYVKFDKQAIYQTASMNKQAEKVEPAKEEKAEEVKAEDKTEETK